MATIAEVKAALQAQAKKTEQRSNGSFGDNASYRFWEIPDGSTATIRFLPDLDPNNTFFWVAKENIKLKFQGVVGDHDKEITISVPCVEMWGDTCPILAEVRPWWKDPLKETLARQYWKKKSYLFEGFVVTSPFEEKEVPQNPIRRFVINPSIYDIIRTSLMNADMEDMPTDYVGGRDFKLSKTKKGEFANYGSSAWSMKTRSLGQDEMIAIEQYKLWDLKEYLGRRPDAEELLVLKEMFHDSVAGQPFDVASYGKYYRPFGTPANGSESKNESVDTDSQLDVTPAKVVEPSRIVPSDDAKPSNPHDILERIKNRTKNK